jgi:choline monooxygenase
MLDRPPGEAGGLPGCVYGSEFYQIEQKQLFPRHWCVAGFESDITNPGDAKPVQLAGWPLVMIRGDDGAVRVFHNICRHRANTLLATPCGGLTRLVCPWHSWSYDLKGRLLATPRLGGERSGEDPQFDRSDVNLKEVPSVSWLGYVMVNIDGNARPFDEHIAPLERLLADYDFAGLKAADAWSIDFFGNWKLTIENAIEDYHLPFVHRELVQGVGESNYRLDHVENCFYSNSTYRDAPGGYADTQNTSASLPAIVHPGRERDARTYAISLFPNGFITVRPDCLWLWMLEPHGHALTRVDTRQFYKAHVADDPRYDGTREQLVALWQHTLEQDAGLITSVQHNMEHPGQTGICTRFSPYWESNVQRFQQGLVHALTRKGA